MIDFYTGPTPNGHRAAIALEESGLAYRTHKLNFASADQRKPEYLAINPAGAIPAIVDPDGPGGKPLTLTQSGAIVLYLAEKTGRFIPRDPLARLRALEWFLQACSDVAGSNMAIAQLSLFAPVKSPDSVAFFEQRLLKMTGDANRQLGKSVYLAGDEVTIADLALYPIVAVRKAMIEKTGEQPHLLRWAGQMAARPAVAKGMTVSLPG